MGSVLDSGHTLVGARNFLYHAVRRRSYGNFGDHIRATVFDDRIEVSSPGRFPGITALDDLTNVRRFARNPRIALARTHFGLALATAGDSG